MPTLFTGNALAGIWNGNGLEMAGLAADGHGVQSFLGLLRPVWGALLPLYSGIRAGIRHLALGLSLIFTPQLWPHHQASEAERVLVLKQQGLLDFYGQEYCRSSSMNVAGMDEPGPCYLLPPPYRCPCYGSSYRPNRLISSVRSTG